MKLYFAPRTRSVRPRWLLEELEVPYELVRVDLSKGENRTPAFLALNPLGDVPVLVDGDVTLTEASAICLFLADRFPDKRLAPEPGSADRSHYLQWLLFAEVTLEPLVLEVYHRAQGPESPLLPSPRLGEVLGAIEARVAGRDFIAGSTFSTADLVMASILHLANTLKLLEGHPRLYAYMLGHAQRPAVRRAVMG